MTAKPACFCGGAGKYADYNCGESFYVNCPHCQGTGTKRCDCTEVDLVCKTYGRGQEIAESRDDDERRDDEDDAHWMFLG